MEFCRLFWILAGFLTLTASQSNNIEEDTWLDALQLITKYGYKGEAHEVETEDGYLLTMHRIRPKEGSESEGKAPILLQHGVLSSSADWVVMGPNFGFGYILADQGYDVWMGNNRGNTYSRKHKTLDPDKDANEFWNFSFHEMGVYDLPAEIDYILKNTSQSSLYYVGHSQGTTQFFVMGAKKPEYNAKIKLMGAFSPVAFMGYVISPFLRTMSPWVYYLETISGYMGLNEYMPSSEFLVEMGQLLCRDGAITQIICSNSIFLIGGYDVGELNQTMLPVIMGHSPAGAATKQLLHFGQNLLTITEFREYDYVLENWLIYGQLTPPEYELEKITAPVGLFYSKNDWLSSETDVERLEGKLPNVFKVHVKHLNDQEFSHLDYLWAIHAPELVYEKFISLMKTYS